MIRPGLPEPVADAKAPILICSSLSVRTGLVMGSGRDEGWGWLSFHDTGGGMSEVDLLAVFERVSHVDRTRLTQADKRLLALGGLRASGLLT